MFWLATRMSNQPSSSQRTPAQAGFTLLEVLVAAVIVSLASIALFRSARNSLQGVSMAGRVEEAVALARTHLAGFAALSDPNGTALEGDDVGGFHWNLKAMPLAALTLHGADERSARSTVLSEVSVTVSWASDGRRASVSLQSQRLTPMPPS